MALAVAGGLAAGSVLFGVYADLAYNVYSATNSSPQTTELFAGDRAPTLWKYVKLGGWQVAGLTAIGMALAAPYGLWWAPAAGGGAAAIIMWAMYRHALAAGSTPQAAWANGRLN